MAERANEHLPPHLAPIRQLTRWAILADGTGARPFPISGKIADEDAWTWDLLVEVANIFNEPPEKKK